jgi:hypothetical protein
MTVQPPYVFISHSTQDPLARDFILNGIEAARIRTWVDFRDIPLDKSWGKEILRAVHKCAVMVVILTRNASESRWVDRETLQADKLGKPMLICRFDDADAPIQIAELQPIDFRAQPNAALLRLIEALQKYPEFQPRSAAQVAENLALPKITRRDLQTPADSPRARRAVQQHPFFDHLLTYSDGQLARAVALDLQVWAENTIDDLNVKGQKIPALTFDLWVGNGGVTLFTIKAADHIPMIEIPLQYLRNTPPFDTHRHRLALLEQLNALMPLDQRFTADRADGRPRLPIAAALATPDKLAAFKAIMDRVVADIRQHEGKTS